jgi:hypothetical protein
MAKTYNPKPRPKPPEAAKACGNCSHCEPEGDAGGVCFGVPPVVLMKLDGTTITALPQVKLTWRCPNYQARS